MFLTMGVSIILFRRGVVGVVDSDEGVDLVNGGTSERRRTGFGVPVERKNVLILSLSIDIFRRLLREK